MAKKKYKNFKVEGEELKQIESDFFESRKRTSIGIFIILTIFVLVVIFLPEISEKVNEYLNPTPVTPVTPNNPEPNEPDEPEKPTENVDETFYEYTPGLKIDRELISVSDINIDATNNTLSYSVTNNENDYQDIEELNYYLEIYNADKTLLERVKLVSLGEDVTTTILAPHAFANFTRNISESSATTIGYLVLVKKTTDDYPEVTLSPDSEGNANLVCTSNHENVTYQFTNNKLKQVTSTIEYLATETNYTDIYSRYQTLSNSYNTTTGITSTFFTSTSGFNITTIVDLEEASRTYIFNADSFALDTEPKVVSFEMEALGFDCN